MMVIRHICSTLILAGASLALATPVSAETSVADRTFTHTLDNGMKIIVREDHRAPVMVSQAGKWPGLPPRM